VLIRTTLAQLGQAGRTRTATLPGLALEGPTARQAPRARDQQPDGIACRRALRRPGGGETEGHLRRQHERDEPAAALVGVRAPQGLGVVPEPAALRHRAHLRRQGFRVSGPAQLQRRPAAPHSLSGARQPRTASAMTSSPAQPQRRPAALPASAAPGSPAQPRRRPAAPHSLGNARQPGQPQRRRQPAQPQRRVRQPACIRPGAAGNATSLAADRPQDRARPRWLARRPLRARPPLPTSARWCAPSSARLAPHALSRRSS